MSAKTRWMVVATFLLAIVAYVVWPRSHPSPRTAAPEPIAVVPSLSASPSPEPQAATAPEEATSVPPEPLAVYSPSEDIPVTVAAMNATIRGRVTDRAGKPVVGAIIYVKDLATTYGSGDRKSTRLNSSHIQKSRMPSSA